MTRIHGRRGCRRDAKKRNRNREYRARHCDRAYHFCHCCVGSKKSRIRRVKYWEIIADKLDSLNEAQL
jgi:hypothetical protein